MLQYLVFVGAAVNFLGSLSYLFDTLKGKNKPNRVSWLMWTIAPLIATAAAVFNGVGWAVLPVFMSGFCPLLIFISSFVNPNAYWKLETFDYLCGLFSLIALVLWWVTQNPVVAIVFAIVSDGFAAVPTLKKSWYYPETESGLVYLVGAFSAVTAFAAIKDWAFSEYAFAGYLVLMNTLLFLSAYGKRVFSKA